MNRYEMHLIKGAEIRTEEFLKKQEKNASALQYGGIRGEVWDVKPTIYAMATAVAVYLNEKSRFYQSKELLSALELAVQFVKRTQRPNGYFDYVTCNFFSAPDTSFCFKRLIAAYRLMVKYDPQRETTGFLQKEYLSMMHHALEGIRDGGFHTPNHRWAICAALMQGANLFAEEQEFAHSLKCRAQQYLAEGIDGDEYGDYAERSTGNYNAVVNNAMLALYQETGDEEFLNFAIRNLGMMLTYFDEDDTIFNQNSTRQDKGRLDRPDKYFYQYLYVCSLKDDPEFAAAAHRIIQKNIERGDLAPDCLHIIMRHDAMQNFVFTKAGFPEAYRKYYPYAGVMRVKNRDYLYTGLRDKSNFLFWKSGSIALSLRIGIAYCDTRSFLAKEFMQTENGCIMKGHAEGWYYEPFENPPETSDWWSMDHTKRSKVITSELDVTVQVTELEDGLRVSVDTEGLDRLPLRLEVAVPSHTMLNHVAFVQEAQPGQTIILRDGMLEVESGTDIVEIGPGFGEHSFKGHYSGEEKNTVGTTICCNAYTPVHREFSIRKVR